MQNDREQKLMDLGAEVLAEALLDLAALSDAAEDLVERLIATPTENLQRFRAKISGLERSNYFIDWRGVSGFSRELEMLLQDLKAGVTDPLTGVELVAEFFKADSGVFENCDDSSGYVGDVFRFNAKELLDVIGSDKRDEVVEKEVALILESPALRESDAIFLVSVGKIDEAEEYILNRSEHLDGDCYGSLLSLAEAMESKNRNLAATLIYRSLLISILERGYTKAYPHGVRYLKKLDNLSVLIAEWKSFDDHEAFKGLIYQEHGRKRSFWSKYGGR